MLDKIAVDLDNTIWDTHNPYLNIYNKKYNKNIKIEDIIKWGFFPEEEFWPIYEESSKLIMDYELYNFVRTNLIMINGMFSVSFVTHGMYNIIDIEKKLGKHGIYPGYVYDKVIVDDRTQKKVRLDFDFFIDDNPHMVVDIREYPEKTLLLFDQPWNRVIKTAYSPFQNVVRVKSWDDIGMYFFNKITERFLCKK